MPLTMWPCAFATVVFLINRMPTPLLTNQSPYLKLFHQLPNYSKLRTFGCLAYPWLRPYAQNKLEKRSLPCVFIGYSLTQSAYHCLDPTTGRIYTTRHVRFSETQFPYTSLTKPNIDLQPAPQNHQNQAPPVTIIPATSTLRQSPQLATNTGSLGSDSPHPSQQSQSSSSSSSAQSDDHTATATVSPAVSSEQQQQSSPAPEPRHHSPPAPQPQQPPLVAPERHPMTTRSCNNIVKPATKYNNAAQVQCDSHWIPTTWQQAMKHAHWRKAMSTEFNSTNENHTWDLVAASERMNVVGCRWVFTIKYNPDGSVRRYKARLVARGYTQLPGIDYTETFSPVIKTTTIRLVLDITVSRSWPIKQLDVNNAFLQGTLTEEVYTVQPPGFVDADLPNHVCRLQKALYGLKQVPRAWYRELSNFLIQYGFINSVADTSLFILRRGSSLVYMFIYVDDILITGNDPALLQRILDSLATRFSVKETEDLNYFLGIEAIRTSTGLHLTQRRYILDLLSRFNLTNAHPVSTLMAPDPKLTIKTGTPLTDPKENRSAVGSLQYLAFTRPDISYAVNKLSQYMHAPTSEHWQAVKRVMRYLAGTASHGLFFSRDNPSSLHAYSDADWAGDTDDFVSTNAYIVYLGKHPISWSSKKQSGVARSSTEAEYRSVANTSAELRWICSLLVELGIKIKGPPVIYCDNVGATYLCANPVFHSRMKLLALDYHFIRNQVTAGALRVAHVSSKDQLADALTKPLARAPFIHVSTKIGIAKAPPS